MKLKICKHCGTAFERKGSTKYCCLKCAVLSRATILGPDDCWIWSGAVGSHGYGAFSFEMVPYTSHRASYMAHKGPIPVIEGHHGAVVMHSCDNRLCINPAHLSIGNQGENLDDARGKGRLANAGPKGELSRTAVLTEGKVLEIRQRLANGEKGVALAIKFNVTPSAISSIKRRKSWTHI